MNAITGYIIYVQTLSTSTSLRLLQPSRTSLHICASMPCASWCMDRLCVYCTIVKVLTMQLLFSISGQVLHFCMWNFVFGNTAHRALVPETKFHILAQKYDGLENIETWSRASEVTLVEAPTQVWVIITLKTNWTAFYHKLPGTLIILNTSFSISATQATQNRTQNYSCRIGQDLLIQLY